MNKSLTPLLDITLSLVAILMFQWFLAFITPAKVIKLDPSAKPRMEFMFSVSWENATDSDVDSWLTRSGKEVCGFNRPSEGHLVLDRDWKNMRSFVVDGKVPETARETMSINRNISGRYQFSLQGYSIRPPEGVVVTVTVEQISPYSMLLDTKVTVHKAEEVPIIEFSLDDEGNVYNKITDRDILRKFLNDDTIHNNSISTNN